MESAVGVFREVLDYCHVQRVQGFETCSVCHKVASRSSVFSVEVVRFQICMCVCVCVRVCVFSL